MDVKDFGNQLQALQAALNRADELAKQHPGVAGGSAALVNFTTQGDALLAAISLGNVDTAKHVVLHHPGVTASMEQCATASLRAAVNLIDSVYALDPSDSYAVVSWIVCRGIDPVVTPSAVRAAGIADFTRFIEHLALPTTPPVPRITIIARADGVETAVAALSSPGDRIAALITYGTVRPLRGSSPDGLKAEAVYAMNMGFPEAASRDADGVILLPSGDADGTRGVTGHDIAPDPALAPYSAGYFTAGSTSLAQIARVVAAGNG